MLYYVLIMIFMSLITYVLYRKDKVQARKNLWRIKESTLLLMSLFLGALGGLLAMYQYRHKTKHWYFVVFNWLFLAVHLYLLIFFFN
jgi:uncharacterized membrane protein YsdA (DUF1294 family)